MKRNDREILEYAVQVFDKTAPTNRKYSYKIIKLLEDPDFLRAIFAPQWDSGEKEKLHSLISEIYDLATRRSCIAGIASSLSFNGYYRMERNSAVFLVSLVNLGMATIDGRATDIGRERDHGEISGSEYNRQMRKLEEYQDDLSVLLKSARNIVKDRAKRLSRETGVPKEMCTSALFTVPVGECMSQNKIGFYLKSVLGNLYGYVNYNGDEFQYDFDEIDWKAFFTAIFGKSRLPDVASLILLEGVGSLDRYDNRSDVKACWDAMTNFALRTLNKAPETVRDQMIELYLKRLNKVLADHNIGLRIDLRMIDDFRFADLAKTIDKYKTKIDAVMEAANRIRNAKPETSPA